MGSIVYWAIIRTAIAIPVLWYLNDYFDSGLLKLLSYFLLYLIVLHPAIVQYKKFQMESEPVIFDTICSDCRHFDETAVICMLKDEHPRADYIPCGGENFEQLDEFDDYD